jgi:hypothetical protein
MGVDYGAVIDAVGAQSGGNAGVPPSSTAQLPGMPSAGAATAAPATSAATSVDEEPKGQSLTPAGVPGGSAMPNLPLTMPPAPATIIQPSAAAAPGSPSSSAPIAPSAASPAPGMPAAGLASSGQPAADANPYAAVIDQVDQARTLAGQMALYGNRDANPEQAAQAAALQPQIGGSSTVIEKDLPAYQAQAQALQNSTILRDNPVLADWLAQNPVAPRVASDDLSNLDMVSRFARQWSQGWSDAVNSNELARLYAQGSGADPNMVASLEATMQASASNPASSGLIHGLATIVGGFADMAEHAAPLAAEGASVGAGVGALAAGVPSAGTLLPVGAGAGALAGGVAGFGAGIFTDAYKIGYGSLMHTLSGVRDTNGNPIDPTAQTAAAMFGGLVNGALNTFGVRFGAEAATKGMSDIVTEGLAQAASRPGVGAALAKAAVNLGKGGLAGAGLGALMEGTNVVAEQAARMASGPDFKTVLNDPQQRQDAINRIADSAATMALTMGTLHGVGELPPLIADTMRARRANDDLSALHGVMQAGAASKTQSRSPSLFEDWVSRQTQGGAAENLFIPGDRVDALYQSMNVHPGGNDGVFGQFVPDIQEQLAQARQTGGDIVVPTAGFAAHLAGTDIANQLMPDIRIRADGMSMREVQDFSAAHADALQGIGEDAQRDYEDEQARVAPRQAVSDDVFSQARGAGFAPETAQQYADLFAARYATRGERIGEDPLDLYRSEGVQIQRELPDSLKAVPPDEMDMLINAVRTGKAEASNGSLFGPSLMQFLAQRGGVEDVGGDLAAMGADTWHQDRPGMRRFIRPPQDDTGEVIPGFGRPEGNKDFTPDAAARAAWEEGYFPGDERPDVSRFHEAISRELSGSPIYADHDISLAEQFRGAARDLRETLDRLGVDPKTATNDEIKAALEQQRQEERGRQFGQPLGEPVAHITGEEIAPKDADVASLRDAARDFYKTNLQGQTVKNDTLGDIALTGRGLSKAMSSSANPDKLRMFAALRDVLQHGRLVKSEENRDLARKPDARRYHYLEASVDMHGEVHRVGVMVEEHKDGKLYYNHNLPDRQYFQDEGEGDQAAGPSRPGAPSSADRQGADAVGLPEVIGPQPSPDKMGSEGDNVNLHVQRYGQPDGVGVTPTAAPEYRGAIRFVDGRTIISLFAKRDLSTLLHETGHLWLEELQRDAASEAAPQQLRDDMSAVRQWLGSEDGAAITTEQHEKFARAVEAYLMEGKAPSVALRGAFQRFRAWLVAIYRSVTALRAPISQEMRQVFDRLIATDEEIARAQRVQGAGQLFRSAEEAGMTDAEFRAYAASVERARGEAVDGLTQKVMADVRRQQTARWKDQEAPIRDQVTQEVDRRPDMQALELLKSGRLPGTEEAPGGRITLSRQAIVDLYGNDRVLSMLPRRVPPIYSESGGLHPDLVAEMVGMRSGDALLKALMGHEGLRRQLRENGDTRSVRQYAIDTETHGRMVEQHGEMLTDGSIQDEAMNQLHNDRRLEVLGAELRALGRRAGAEATPVKLARDWADRTIGDKDIKAGTRPDLYQRAEAKAGRAAEKALLAGDHAGAFRQKQKQLLNHALYMSAKDAKDDVAAGMARLERFGRKAEFPTIAPSFVDRIHELLRRFDLPSKRNGDELDRALNGVSLQQWATERMADGHEIYIAPELYDTTYARPTDTLTVNQFRDLADTVRSIGHAGRDMQQVVVDGEKAQREQVVQQMVDQAGSLIQRAPRDFANQGGETGARGMAERGADLASRFHAMLLKPEAILDRLDAEDPNGVFNRAVWRPIKAAQGVANDLQAEVAAQLRGLKEKAGDGYGKDFDKSLPEQPGITDPRTGGPMALKRRGLIAIALNTGNESNLGRLLDGYSWTQGAVQALLDRHMTEADWHYVQGVWDTFENLFPRIEAMQRRLTGVGLEKIEPREVETPFGKFKGGYYPVVYDRNLSLLGDRIRASGEQRFEADYVRATTPKGHTISRVTQMREPLSLNPDIIAWKLGQSVHDLAYREAILNADKLLRDRRVMTAIDNSIGRDQRQQLDRWLQGVANDRNIDTRGLAAMDAFFHRLRANSMVVNIGFRATTMMKHGMTALSNSVGELGPTWLARGSTEFFGSWDKMRRNYEFITGASAEMRHRMNEIDRDVRDAVKDSMGKTGWVADAQRFGHYGVGMLDMLSALPTWLGAYRKAQAQGMEEADAVAYADKTVRNAHGANGAPDMAAIQRGSETQKLFTMFYGFFNHIYNRQVVGARAAVSGVRNLRSGNLSAAGGDFAKTLSTFFFYLTVPALIEAAVSQGGPGQNGSWLDWAAKLVLGEVPAGVPVLRDVADSVMHGRSYEMSPVGQTADSFISLGKDIGSVVGLRGKPASSQWLRHAIETPGYVLGLPTGQAAGTAQFLADVAGGKEDPQDVQDWLRGVIYGPQKAKVVAQ